LSVEISLVQKFYTLVEARDEVLITNFERYRAENNQRRTILITGGFHAEKIKRKLIEKNTSFISLIPKIDLETKVQDIRGLYLNNLTRLNPHVATLALANAFENGVSVSNLFADLYETHVRDNETISELDFKNMLVDALIAQGACAEDQLNDIAQRIYALHPGSETDAAKNLFEIDPQTWTIDIAIDGHMHNTIYPIRDGLEGTMSIGATTRHEATHDWNDVRPAITELEKMVTAGDEDHIISIANGNLYMNDHFVVWKDGALFHRYGEPVSEREYTCFVVWKDGHVSAERLVFVGADLRVGPHAGEEDPKTYTVYRAGGTEDLSEKIRFASYGQRLLSEGKTVPISELSDEFDDLFHLFKFPQVHKNDNNGLWGPAIGAKFLYRTRPSEKTYTSEQYKKTKVVRPLVRRLLQGESIRFNTKIYEREFGTGIVQKSLNASGYTEVDYVQNQGEYKWINTNTIEIKFFRYRMAHNLLGITQSGKVVSYVITGHKGKTPTGIGCTPKEAGKQFAQAWNTQNPTDHLHEIFLVSNGMDSLRRENGRVMISGGRGAYDTATSAYVFTEKKSVLGGLSRFQKVGNYLAQREVYETQTARWTEIEEEKLIASKVDVMLICGSNDKERTPQAAAELYKKITAEDRNKDIPIIITGKWGDHCGTAGQERTEAEEFRDAMVARGIDPAVIILEKEALNLGQNIQYARPIIIRALSQRNISDANILVIHNPSGQRRAGETFIEQFRWKDGDRDQKQPFDAISDDGTKDIKISKVFSFAPYTHAPFAQPRDDLDNASVPFMLGEIERLIKYQPPRGNFIGRADIPDDVLKAYGEYHASGDVKNNILEYKYEKAAQKGYAMLPDDINLDSVKRRFDPETNLPWNAEKNPFELAAWNLMPEKAANRTFLNNIKTLQNELFRGVFDISRGSPDVYIMEREHFHIAPFPYYSFVDSLDRAENLNARLADPVWSKPESIEKALAITQRFTAGLEAPTIQYKKVILTGDGTLVIVGIPSNDAIYRIRTDLINELRENGFPLNTPVEWVHSTIGRLLRKPTGDELRLLQERIKAINERFDTGEGLPVWQDVRRAFFSDNNNNVILNPSPNEKWWTIGALPEQTANDSGSEQPRTWPEDVKEEIVSVIDHLATEIATSVRGSYVSFETDSDVLRFSIKENSTEQNDSLARYRIAVATHIKKECEAYARAKGYVLEINAYPGGFEVVYKGSSAAGDTFTAATPLLETDDEADVSRGVSELFLAAAYPKPSRAFVGVYIEKLSRRSVDLFYAFAESSDRVVLYTESISALDRELLDELLSIPQVTVRTPEAGIIDPRIGWAEDFRMAVDELPFRYRRIVAPRHVLAELARTVNEPERVRYLFMVGSSADPQAQYSDGALIAILPFAFLPLDMLDAQALLRKQVKPNGIPAYYELAFDRFISLDLISRLAQEITFKVTDLLRIRLIRQAA
jgi:hypothetical protein